MSNGSRQAERSAATKRKLIDAALVLFAERGYAEVSTEELVRRAGVTRGAMYHQFPDKAELLAAVVEQLDAQLAATIGARAMAQIHDPIGALQTGAEAFLDAVENPATRQVLLIDAPSVLGHARWRDIGMRHGLGLIEQVLAAGMDAGIIRRSPTRALAQMLMAAMDEGALMVADAEPDDRTVVRREVDAVVRAFLEALRGAAS